ncbi:NADH dehydrogenase [ubiquinone] 1 alpha subcomplex subunit 10, mitochondrial [Copidosoma floridanum]|uniref:NADH dehydrogenase [ubiquinone] 1 alpha subcomplex subunit 10, mitochondrial n=1 Tax=Copidosoma floridanum TaxID=29053 RepID=UPI0006C93E16|nr:NADH dehydrogenase [ubiquinone] 1 alpha subcomplex subunit 10, mitochondrial [Copidosoma floridanum]
MYVALKSGLAGKLLPSVGTTAKELCKILPQRGINKIQVAGLTRIKYRDESETRNIKPFPYHLRNYTWRDHLLLDVWNGCRVQKHTKLIAIDGPVACGKEKFAKKLAEELDFLYLPQPTFDDLYITHWGFDARTLDAKLPKGAQTWDIERFCQEPYDIHSGMMQVYMYFLRQVTYIKILKHIFCTGQGVVTVRTPWSDAVFAKAMYKSKYIPKRVLNAHKDICSVSLPNYLKPHLIIYLDVPIEKTMENINKNGQPFEKNAKAFSEQYLTEIDNAYKREYLPFLDDYSLLLCYDWTEEGDFELVMEDIEDLDFERYSNHETKLADWRLERGVWRYYCRIFSSNDHIILRNMDIMRFDVPELGITGEDTKAWTEAWREVADSKYSPGYNILKGEKNLLFKTGMQNFGKDYVTPLMEKYYERKKREEGNKRHSHAIS